MTVDDVTVATVTYGRRAHLLTQALDAARAQGAAGAVIIDNGAQADLARIIASRYGGDWARIISLGANRGSAAGFAAAITAALDQAPAHILLLDDDNVMAQGCLAELIAVFAAEAKSTPLSHLLVLGFRADRHQRLMDIASGAVPRPLPSSFRGFHLCEIPAKWRRRRGLHGAAPGPVPRAVPIPAASYGGMFFHKSLIETIGLPDQRFFLYEDDIEYTSRLGRHGGKILLAGLARIADCDVSWNLKHETATSFAKWLDADSPTRRYYAFRNGTFLDLRRSAGNRIVTVLNMALYLAMMGGYALLTRQPREFGTIIRAALDGAAGNFKANPRHDAI